MKKLIPVEKSRKTFYTEKLESWGVERGASSTNRCAAGVQARIQDFEMGRMNFLHLNQRNQILFQYLRDKKKKKLKKAQKKGGENSPISPLLDPRLVFLLKVKKVADHRSKILTKYNKL